MSRSQQDWPVLGRSGGKAQGTGSVLVVAEGNCSQIPSFSWIITRYHAIWCIANRVKLGLGIAWLTALRCKAGGSG